MKTVKHHYLRIITIVFMCSGLLSCQSSMTPLQASEKFWSGIKKRNISLITIYSLSDSGYSAEELKQLPEVAAIAFGRIIIDGNTAEIETQVTIKSDEKNIDVSLKTYLEREDNAWKVNYKQAVLPLKTNQGMIELFDDVQEITEELAEEIEESVEDLKEKTLPEIESQLEQAEESLRDKIPEFKNMLDELLEGIKRSIEEAIPPNPNEEEPKTQQT